jgi:hypothetical protein
VAKLVYLAIASLDGYVADEDDNFDWAVPDEEVHAFINDLARPVGTYLYGRRMYEMMVGWENDPSIAEQSPPFARLRRDLAGGRQGRLLQDAGGRLHLQDADGTSLQPRNGPAAKGIRGTGPHRERSRSRHPRVLGRAGGRVRPVPGARRGGGGKRALSEGVRVGLELLDERRFGNGMVYLRHRTTG